ncbi:MAG: response regulator [Thermodesulfobacteriota bacterium]
MITTESRSILVADDSMFFRIKLSDILSEAGHKVMFAKDGREVIKEVSINSIGIDLLVLDLQMPDVDGFGVLEWIKENGYQDKFPILVITGVYEGSEVIERLKELGAAGLMSKAFTPEHIIYMVNNVLFSEKAAKGQHRIRVPISIPIDFKVGEKKLSGFLLNISCNGVFLHTKEGLLRGTVVHLIFTLPGIDRVFNVKGVVRWSTAESDSDAIFGGSGIMFDSVSPEDQKSIEEFITREAKNLGLE